MRWWSGATWLAIIVAAAAASAIAAEAGKDRIAPRPAEAFDLADAAGVRHTAAKWQGKKGVLLLFLATECPVCNFYAPEFSRLAKTCAEHDILAYGVHCDADLTAADADKHAKEYSLTFPILLDPKQKLAQAVGATVTPQAVLLSPSGEVLYRGRVDDRFSLTGKRRDVPTRHELADAIDAVIAGKAPPIAETKCFGCSIPKLP